MQKVNLRNLMVGFLCSSLFFSSCVDNAYDFDKVDLTITIGGENMALPFGNTEEILLKKFFKVEDSELLDTLTTGEYKLTKLEKIDDSEVSIKAVTIKGPVVDAEPFVVYPVSAKPVGQLVQGQYTEENVESFGDFEMRKEDMPIDILSVYTFNIKNAPAIATLSFASFKEGGDITAIEEIDLDGLEISFPRFIIFEKDQDIDSQNKYTFGQEIIKVNELSSYTKDFRIASFDFYTEGHYKDTVVYTPVNPEKPEYHLLEVEDVVTITGKVTAKNIDLAKVEKDIQLVPKVVVEDLPVFGLLGQVDPEIDVDDTAIELDDLPDFLQDDDVRMHFADPKIYFTVDNTTELPISVEADMTSMKNGQATVLDNDRKGQIHVGGEDDPIIIPGFGKYLVLLSKTGNVSTAGLPVTSDYVVQYKAENINNLIEIIPDSIQLEIQAQTVQDRKHEIELGNKYIVGMDYEIDMILAFNTGTKIVYNDTIDGWNEDIKKYEIKKLVITADVDNTIPLEIDIVGEALDVHGNRIAGIEVDVRPANDAEEKIAAGTGMYEDEPVLTPVIIEITMTVEGAMKELDGLLVKFLADPNDNTSGVPLKNRQFLLMKNMKAKVPGGLTIDLN